MAKRRDIVQHEEPAPERSRHQIALPPLNLERPNIDGWHPAFDPHPVRAAIYRERHPEFRSREEQVGLLRVLNYGPHRIAIRQIAGNRMPRTA